MSLKQQNSPLIVPHPSLFSAEEIEEFENILGNSKSTEHDVSYFLERCPRFLWFNGAGDIKREVVLQTSENKLSRVDFFKQNFGQRFYNIVELKGPGKPLLSALGTDHVHLSSVVSKAISQARDYRDYIIEDATVRARLEQSGILVSRPQLLVMVGQEPKNIDARTLDRLFDRAAQSGVSIASYTDMLAFAKEHYRRDKTIFLPAPTILASAGNSLFERIAILLESIKSVVGLDSVVLLTPSAENDALLERTHSVGDREMTFHGSRFHISRRTLVAEVFRENKEFIIGQADRNPFDDSDTDYGSFSGFRQRILRGGFPLPERKGVVLVSSLNWKYLPEEERQKIRPLCRLLSNILPHTSSERPDTPVWL